MPVRLAAPDRLLALVRTSRQHAAWLWWAHSLYALALGVAFMWLGSRNFAWLRLAAFNIAFIWITSVLAASLVGTRGPATPWWPRAWLVINYVNRNFYQQVLFFILPVYYASATAWTANFAFVVLLALSAVLSTLDVVYDRVLSTNRWLAAGFFGFNAFAAVNVALPVVLAASNRTALRLATLAAVVGFVTIAVRVGQLRRRPAWAAITAGALVVFLASEAARPLVPPAPLRLAGTSFGLGFDRRGFTVTRPVADVPPASAGRLYAVTAVVAPVGLNDRVSLRWRQGPRTLWISPAHDIAGGRAQGFRLWSAVPADRLGGADPLQLDVVTEAGQLIGRAALPARPVPSDLAR